MKLYRVSIKVIPTKDHPLFFEVQFGVLHAWLYAENPEDAGERVVTIAEQLPYERFGPAAAWQDSGTWRATVRQPNSSDPPEFAPHIKAAREVGFAMCMDYLRTGMDEAEFVEINPR